VSYGRQRKTASVGCLFHIQPLTETREITPYVGVHVDKERERRVRSRSRWSASTQPTIILAYRKPQDTGKESSSCQHPNYGTVTQREKSCFLSSPRRCHDAPLYRRRSSLPRRLQLRSPHSRYAGSNGFHRALKVRGNKYQRFTGLNKFEQPSILLRGPFCSTVLHSHQKRNDPVLVFGPGRERANLILSMRARLRIDE
jgi:hypothetical protein